MSLPTGYSLAGTMKLLIQEQYYRFIKRVKDWSDQKLAAIFMFNMIMIILVLLRSAGYFVPYFPITINLIVFLGIILSIVLLNIGTKAVFGLALIFWLITLLFQILRVTLWAERVAIYAFEALFVGLILLVIEDYIDKRK